MGHHIFATSHYLCFSLNCDHVLIHTHTCARAILHSHHARPDAATRSAGRSAQHCDEPHVPRGAIREYLHLDMHFAHQLRESSDSASLRVIVFQNLFVMCFFLVFSQSVCIYPISSTVQFVWQIVNRHNIARMRALVKNGTTVWPGAKFIIRPDGKPTDLRFAKENERHLEIGYSMEA